MDVNIVPTGSYYIHSGVRTRAPIYSNATGWTAEAGTYTVNSNHYATGGDPYAMDFNSVTWKVRADFGFTVKYTYSPPVPEMTDAFIGWSVGWS